MSLLANELNVRSVLCGQMSLAAVNQICVIYEAMNDCKNLKIHQRLASKSKFRFMTMKLHIFQVVLAYSPLVLLQKVHF